MNEAITFDDVLIEPCFSFVESRKDVNLEVNRLGLGLKLPIISANMDTITDGKFAIAMAKYGAIGCLHRFWDIETNVKEFKSVILYEGHQAMCSVGLGSKELERAEALIDAGCTSLIIDVANGASVGVVKQIKELRALFNDNVSVTAGNFATADSVQTFLEHTGNIANGIKTNIGAGSRCLTRTVTGCGYPQLSAIMEISNVLKRTGITVIADGGMNTVGDCAKALGAGAHLLMSGSFFAGCEECPGKTVWKDRNGIFQPKEVVYPRKANLDGTYTLMENYQPDLPAFKKYRGSASVESYEVQGKTAQHRAAEGDSTYVPYKGPVKNVLQEIEGGLRSAFSYTNSRTLEEFHKNTHFVRVSNNTVVENGTRNGVK